MRTMIFLLLAGTLSQAIRAQSMKAPDAKQQQLPPQPGSSGSVAADPVYQPLTTEAQARITQTTKQVGDAFNTHNPSALPRLEIDMAHWGLVGYKFCGDHTVGDATWVDAFERSEDYEAFAVPWLGREPGIAAHSAIFTNSGRCVAIDGGVTKDGQVIAAVMPNSMAVSRAHGLVAYEAEYWSSVSSRDAGLTPHRGIFIENRLLGEVNTEKGSAPFHLNDDTLNPDFHWNNADETLDLKPGVVLPREGRKPLFTPNPALVKQPAVPPAPPAAQNGCADSKLSQAKKILGGLFPGGGRKVLEKIQPCPATPTDGQGAKN
jgi:hypothetical protein